MPYYRVHYKNPKKGIKTYLCDRISAWSEGLVILLDQRGDAKEPTLRRLINIDAIEEIDVVQEGAALPRCPACKEPIFDDDPLGFVDTGSGVMAHGHKRCEEKARARPAQES